MGARESDIHADGVVVMNAMNEQLKGDSSEEKLNRKFSSFPTTLLQ